MVLFPNFDSDLYNIYKRAVFEYKEYIEVIVLSDNKVENNWDYLNDLFQLGIIVHLVKKENYEEFSKSLIQSGRYKIIMPTHYDMYQHLYGFDIFSKKEIYKKFNILGLKTPKIYETDFEFPLIAKPTSGTGGHGVKKFYNRTSLDGFIKQKPYDFIDFGNEYQFEEYIEGSVVSITFCKINDTPLFLSMYDIDYDSDLYFMPSKRSAPSKFYTLLGNTKIDNFLNFTKLFVPNNGFLTIDAVIKDNEFYIVDAGYRLPCSALSKYLFSDFVFDYLKYRIGDTNNLPIIKSCKIIQKYINTEQILGSNLKKFQFVKEFVKTKKYMKDSWNQKQLFNKGYIVIESNNPSSDLNRLIRKK